MAINLMTVPANDKTQLEKISLNLVRTLTNKGIKATLFQPIVQEYNKNGRSFNINYVENLLSQGNRTELLDDIIDLYKKLTKNFDVVIVQGLRYLATQTYVADLNVAIANALDAKVIILASAKTNSSSAKEQIKIAAHLYNARTNSRVLGYILNKVKTKFKIREIECLSTTSPLTHFVAKHLNTTWIEPLITSDYRQYFSSAMFRHQLVKKAKKANKRILLPESNDPRIIKAAVIATRRKLAKCILLGDPKKIEQIAEDNEITLSSKIEIINPAEIREKYVKPMVDIRKGKGLTSDLALKHLQNNHTLAVMMLQQGEADGVTAGVAHSTAHIVRTAFQLIKKAPNHKFVSSLFFMCFPEQVLVFADCAINPNPTTNRLANIAIQSNDTAKLFGVEPNVAMISYTTGKTRTSPMVDKVIKATELVKKRRPDILVDGPLQYDAALIEEVAKNKIANSPVAGHATICIFPELNTGNSVYKAAQRSANIVSIGPILQGLSKPVNDLSRGATVDDIVYTIAVTAIQAS